MPEPSLAEIIRSAIASAALDTHTAIPARVLAYNPIDQTCTARPTVKAPIPQGRDGWRFESLPDVQNVPVAWPRGGGAALQFPLTPGDHVLLVFVEADASGWRETGQEAPPFDLERHGLSHPVAIPGISPDADTLRTVTAPHIEVPAGQALTVGGDPTAADYVALAGLVYAELGKIANAFKTFIPGSGGASFPNAYVAPSSAADIASDALKARE